MGEQILLDSTNYLTFLPQKFMSDSLFEAGKFPHAEICFSD